MKFRENKKVLNNKYLYSTYEQRRNNQNIKRGNSKE